MIRLPTIGLPMIGLPMIRLPMIRLPARWWLKSESGQVKMSAQPADDLAQQS